MASVGGWTFSSPATADDLRVATAEPPSEIQELHWLRLSAQQGNVPAQEYLALKYYFGDGVSRQYAEALNWMRRALAGKNGAAPAYFSDVRLDGSGEKSTAQHLRWLKLGAHKGIVRAQEELGLKLYRGEGTPRDLDEARSLLTKASDQGSPLAHYHLGRMHLRGEGVKPDLRRALLLLRKAAEQGVADAMVELGALQAEGRKIPRNDEEAVFWLRKAAAAENPQARTHLWALAEEGRTAPADGREAGEWIRAAAAAGLPAAQRRNGDLWFRRVPAPRHLNEYGCLRMAAFWYARAARQGDSAAQLQLARMHLEGKGVEPSLPQAYSWARQASLEGHEEAEQLATAVFERMTPEERSKIIPLPLP